MRTILLSIMAVLFLSTIVSAQLCISPEAETFYEKAMKEINIKHSDWVNRTAANILSGKADPGDLPTIAGNYRHEVNIAAMDIEGLMALVLMQVAKDNEADLRDMLEEMKRQNEQKKKLREILNLLKQQQKDQSAMLRSKYDSLKKLVDPEPVIKKTNIIQSKKVTQTEIKNLMDNLRDKLDSLSELSEELSLKLQLLMDRLNKYMCMLSDLLKKISDSANSIIQNLK